MTALDSRQNATSKPDEPGYFGCALQPLVVTENAGEFSLSPNVALLGPPPPSMQCAAKITSSGWTSVPVQPPSATVVGQPQGLTLPPP